MMSGSSGGQVLVLTNLLLLYRAAIFSHCLYALPASGAAPRCLSPRTWCPSSISAPMLASLSAASLPRLPVCDRTCSILTSSPRSCWSCRYASRTRVASRRFAQLRPLFAQVKCGEVLGDRSLGSSVSASAYTTAADGNLVVIETLAMTWHFRREGRIRRPTLITLRLREQVRCHRRASYFYNPSASAEAAHRFGWRPRCLFPGIEHS